MARLDALSVLFTCSRSKETRWSSRKKLIFYVNSLKFETRQVQVTVIYHYSNAAQSTASGPHPARQGVYKARVVIYEK
jgi:hypothetical protein